MATTKNTGARKRANESFLQRYGMTQTEWAAFKKTATKEEVMEKRELARGRIKIKLETI